MRRARLIAAIFVCLLALGHGARAEAGQEPLLEFDYSGSSAPGAAGPEFMRLMERWEVQRALLAFASGPQPMDVLETALRGSGASPSDLERLGLIRREGNAYALSFWLYTREDLDRIRAVAEVEGRSLAAAMLERRAEFDAIIERIPQPGADPAALAFFLIGCACLDWDGLRVTVEEGYRTSPGPDGFLPEALEPGGGGSRRGLYWGSHNEMGTVTLTTFGDHHSTRYGFPDLVGWRVKTALAASEIPATLGSRITGLLDDFLFEEIGEVMLELRAGDRTREELALAAGLSPEVADRLLALLVEMDYVHEGADGRFTARIPVLAGRDSEAVVELRRLGQGVIGEWLAERHGALREELSDLTAVRHGVPLADGFYWIWHYLFGVANRELVAAGWLADPYAAERRFKGYIPAVFHHTSLANGPLPEAP